MNSKADLVVITGSNGRIGAAVMKRLREGFDKVVGFIDHEWEAFFAGVGSLSGSETIITSVVSKAWPVPMLKRTRLAGIHKHGKNAASCASAAPTTREPGKPPPLAAIQPRPFKAKQWQHPKAPRHRT
ncbi:MAG: hypothetical protein ABI135_04495 [Rhodoferax sp.]